MSAPKLPELNLVLLGGGGVGAKSSLVHYLFHGRLPDEYDPTIEDSYNYKFSIDGQEVLVHITDTAGQEEYSPHHDQLLREADIVFLGFAVNSEGSFSEVSHYYDSVCCVKDNKDFITIGIGNKADLVDQRQVSKEEAEAYFSSLDPPAPYFETSCVTGANVMKVWEEAIRMGMVKKGLIKNSSLKGLKELLKKSFHRKKDESHPEEPATVAKTESKQEETPGSSESDEPEFTMTLIGSGGIGAKTSLVTYLLCGHLYDCYDPTIEDSYTYRFLVDGRSILVKIVDTAGQEEYSAMRYQYMRTTDVAVIGFTVTSESTFIEAKRLYEELCRAKDSDHVLVVGVGNKIDLVDQREVKKEDAEAFFSSLPLPSPYIETSCKTGENVMKVFETAIRLWLRRNEKPSPPKKKGFKGLLKFK